MSAEPKPTADPMMQKMLTLVTLHRQARHRKKPADLYFMMVNQTFNVVPYRSCLFWRWDGESLSPEAASGLVHLDGNSPFAIWIKSVVPRLLKEKSRQQVFRLEGQKPDDSFAKAYPVTSADCAGSDRQHWSDWVSSHAILLTMKDPDDKIRYGLWLDREEAFNETEIAFLEDIADTYAHVLHRMEGSGGRAPSLKSALHLGRSKMAMLFVAACVVLALPTRMTVTAPAEVVARNPLVVSVPFEGVIQDVVVKPNQLVKKGDPLVIMDGTTLRNKSEMVGQELATAQEALTKTEREALKDPTKLPELNLLRAQIREKEENKKYADELLSRAQITAERDGIAIFPDANALRGKPVLIGEQIMQLADPDDSELLIRIPVDGMIVLDQAAPVSFFLNVSPLGSQEAKIESIGYQATADHDGLLTYKVRAGFDGSKQHPRVGWTGSAKAYGDETYFIFNILRRPVVTLRRKLGI